MANERDWLTGLSTSLNGFGVTGFQWGFASNDISHLKTPTLGAPMTINTNPPGIAAINDKLWQKTYGCSMDGFLTLVNGETLQNTVDSIPATGTLYATTPSLIWPTADDINIYKRVSIGDNRYQQVQYVVSKDTAAGGASATDFYGEMEDIRTIGIRMPGIAGGWGKTVALAPTDVYKALSSDVNSNLNDEEHKLDRASWKYGPIDLRWDPRRNVWAAWNDMTVDNFHSTYGFMDTLVFSAVKGGGDTRVFGGWSDVFWVRGTNRTAVFNGSTADEIYGLGAFNKTGEVFTKTSHRWYDETNDGVAEISTSFIVNHPVGTSHTVAEETTIEGGSVDILTTTHFTTGYNATHPAPYDGPLAFSTSPGAACSFTGEIVWDSTINKWVPRITLGSTCAFVGDKITELVNNDALLGTRIVNVCNALSEYTLSMEEILEELVNGQMNANQLDIEDIVQEAAEAAASYAATLRDDSITDDSRVISRIVDAVNVAFEELAATILERCGCTIETPVVVVDPFDTSIPPFSYTPTPLDLFGIDLGIIDCDAFCRAIELNAPCTDRAPVVAVGIPCVYDVPPVIRSAGGDCS